MSDVPDRVDSAWRIGDTVTLCPNGRFDERVRGTIATIDEPGRPLGVRVEFDRLVNGVDNCYATHDELTLVRRG